MRTWQKPKRLARLSSIDFLLVALAVFIVIKQINRMRKPAEEPAPARTCPYCKSEIADDATRCPHCTSQLD